MNGRTNCPLCEGKGTRYGHECECVRATLDAELETLRAELKGVALERDMAKSWAESTQQEIMGAQRRSNAELAALRAEHARVVDLRETEKRLLLECGEEVSAENATLRRENERLQNRLLEAEAKAERAGIEKLQAESQLLIDSQLSPKSVVGPLVERFKAVLEEVKLRIIFTGHPGEPMDAEGRPDWARELNLIEQVLHPRPKEKP